MLNGGRWGWKKGGSFRPNNTTKNLASIEKRTGPKNKWRKGAFE
jgi:hypothetical protein